MNTWIKFVNSVVVVGLLLTSSFAFARVDQEFTFNNYAEPESLDPAKASGVYEHNIFMALFEGLTNLHPKTLDPVPGVAKSWKISNGGRTYTFTLRKNAKWSNGEPLTAEDFVYAWQRVLDPKTGGPYAYHLFHIENGKEYNSGELKDPAQLGVKALSDTTLEVQLNQPTPYFLYVTAFYTTFPVHKKTIEKHGDKWTRKENIVSNGPFTLEAWKPGERITVVKAQNYWDAPNVRLERINILPIENRDTALNLYTKGRLHWTGHNQLPESRMANLKKRDDFRAAPQIAVWFFRVNTTRKPFDSPEIRQALYLAIDRAVITDRILQSGVPAHSITPPWVPGYSPPEAPKFNPVKAAEILSSAGYCTPRFKRDGCKQFPKFDVLYNTNEQHKLVLQAIQQMWKQHLGITQLSIINREWKVYLKDQRSLQYDITRSGWIGDFPDPMTFIDMWVKDGGNNFTGWHNTKYDELVEASRREANPEERMKILREAESLLMKEMPVIPVYFYTSAALVSPRLGGFYDTIQDVHPYKSMYIKAPPVKP